MVAIALTTWGILPSNPSRRHQRARIGEISNLLALCYTFGLQFGAITLHVAPVTRNARISKTLENKGQNARFQMVRVRRIELLPQAWEAHVLPLNYTRKIQGP